MISRTMILSILFSGLALCQVPDNIARYRNDSEGNYSNRKQGTLVGNRINSIFMNFGEIGHWSYPPTCEWPADSGRNNLNGFSFIVGAEVIAPGDTQAIHPLEAGYYEQYNYDPSTGAPWDFEPVGGYANAQSMSPATSTDPGTWPSHWPAALNLPSASDGHWYGYFGIDSMKAAQEVFFVMDDSQDKKFNAAPCDFYPILSDSSRGGLGLRVEVRAFQWNDALRKDIVFLKYSVWNISDFDYDKTVFGIYCQPGVGGANSTTPANSAGIDSADGLAYMWAPSGIGSPGGWRTGFLGIGILSAPADSQSGPGLSMKTCSLSDKSPAGLWPRNNDAMWQAMTGGVDTAVENTNLNVAIGSGLFQFRKWTNEEFVTTIIMGTDLTDVLKKKSDAEAIYQDNFQVPDSLYTFVRGESQDLPAGYFLSQNYPNPFNPSTTITYRLLYGSFVTVKVYDVLGREVRTLVNTRQSAGIHTVSFEGRGLPSGVYFYRLEAGNYREAKKMILMK